MVEKVIDQNRELMRSLRSNFNEAKNDLAAFVTLWKYIQNKERSQKIQNVEIN
jgi:hypothetical protein